MYVVAGWSSLVARRAHNPKVVGSNPAPATNLLSVVSISEILATEKLGPFYRGFLLTAVLSPDGDGACLESGLRAHFLLVGRLSDCRE